MRFLNPAMETGTVNTAESMSRSRSNAVTLRESIEGRTADALALGGEEGRDKLR